MGTGRTWKAGEVAYLARVYLRQPVEKTASDLKRTKTAVHLKAHKLGLSYEFLTAQVIADCFHIDSDAVKRWVDKLNLKSIKTPYKSGYRYYIKIEDFWEWAYENRGKINWSKYELKSLLPEPEWVKKEKQNCLVKKSHDKITGIEIMKIKNMRKKGITYKNIALELGRTEYSIYYIKRKYIDAKK